MGGDPSELFDNFCCAVRIHAWYYTLVHYGALLEAFDNSGVAEHETVLQTVCELFESEITFLLACMTDASGRSEERKGGSAASSAEGGAGAGTGVDRKVSTFFGRLLPTDANAASSGARPSVQSVLLGVATAPITSSNSISACQHCVKTIEALSIARYRLL